MPAGVCTPYFVSDKSGTDEYLPRFIPYDTPQFPLLFPIF